MNHAEKLHIRIVVILLSQSCPDEIVITHCKYSLKRQKAIYQSIAMGKCWKGHDVSFSWRTSQIILQRKHLNVNKRRSGNSLLATQKQKNYEIFFVEEKFWAFLVQKVPLLAQDVNGLTKMMHLLLKKKKRRKVTLEVQLQEIREIFSVKGAQTGAIEYTSHNSPKWPSTFDWSRLQKKKRKLQFLEVSSYQASHENLFSCTLLPSNVHTDLHGRNPFINCLERWNWTWRNTFIDQNFWQCGTDF